MVKKSKTEEEKAKSTKSTSNDSFLNRSWHGVSVMVLGIVTLVIVVGVATALILVTNGNEGANISDQQLYTPEEKEAVEASQLDDDVDEALSFQSEGDNQSAYAIWQEKIENTTDPDEKSDALYQLALSQWNGGDFAEALNSLIAIEGLGSNIDLFQLYSTASSVAIAAGDGPNAVKYTELTIENIRPENFEIESEYESYIETFISQLSKAKEL